MKLEAQGTILTFILCFRFMSSVASLISFERARTFEEHLPAMDSAVKYCTEVGLSSRLSKELESANVIGQFESFLRLTPWKRHPATLTLKTIYPLLAVCVLHPCTSNCTGPTWFQKSGYPNLQESVIDARLRAFWDAYTWEVVPNSNLKMTARPRLNIRYVDLI